KALPSFSRSRPTCTSTGCSGSAWSKVYRYDNVGRVLETDGKDFSYDAASRFQLLRVAGESADRTYDPVGRLRSRLTATGETDTYAYGPDGFLQEQRRGDVSRNRRTSDYAGNRVKTELLGSNPQTTWDLGNYKIVYDRTSGKYFHTLYVTGQHGSRIAHRTQEKPSMAAASLWSARQDRTLASMYEPMSRGGLLPWAKHRAAAAFKTLINDLDGARGLLNSLTALAMLGGLLALSVVSARQLIAHARHYLMAGHRRGRRFAWLAPTAVCALAAACMGKYETEAPQPATADSIAKEGRYSIMQALTPGGTN